MAMPVHVLRSYGGGAVVAQLVNYMGSTDTAFTIFPTTDWVENDESPLGTVGPFTVVVDRFTPTVEKILCSSINLTTGVVQVYASGGFSGRGYDGTTPQAHTPNGSAAGVQTCWSAYEAQEANQAVALVYGNSGAAPADSDVLTWVSGAPAWTSGGGPGAVASGEMYCISTTNIFSGTWTDVPMAPAVNLTGGMTYSGNSLIVPSAGQYLVCGQAEISVTTDNVGMRAACYSSEFSTQEIYGSSGIVVSSISGSPASSFAKVITCEAGEQLKLQLIQDSGTGSAWPLSFIANGVTNWFTVTAQG